MNLDEEKILEKIERQIFKREIRGVLRGAFLSFEENGKEYIAFLSYEIRIFRVYKDGRVRYTIRMSEKVGIEELIARLHSIVLREG